MKYNITRKYGLPRYENFDLSILETEKDPLETLKDLDKIAEEYIAELKKKEAQDEPSKTYRIGNEWFILNKKQDVLYRKEPSDKKPITKGSEPIKGNAPF